MRALRLAAVVGLLLSIASLTTLQQSPAMENVRHIGEIAEDKGIFTVKGAKATLVIGKTDADTYRVTAEVKPADKATRLSVQVMPEDVKNANKQAALHATFYRDAPGLQLQAGTYRWDAQKGVWGGNNDDVWYRYWPAPPG